MRTLAGSIVVLSGAVMLGAGQLSQAIALSGRWDDTPVSMRVIGCLLCVIGLAVMAAGLISERNEQRLAALSGAILVLAGAAIFASSKIALTIAHLAGYPEKPIVMIAVGTAFSLGGVTIVLNCCRKESKTRAGTFCSIDSAK
jgi:uncharacterized membrane protein